MLTLTEIPTLKRLFPVAAVTALIVLAALMMTACTTPRGLKPEDIPTLASLSALETALPLTQNAPPAPYNGVVTAFSSVDNGLTDLSGWRYLVQLDFEGTFADYAA